MLKAWGQEWRRANGKGQQDLGRVAGYGSDESPKSAAVAISRIESGKTDPAGRYRLRLLDALGHTEAELEEETERALAVMSRPGVFARAMAGPIHMENEARRAQIIASSNLLTERVTFQIRNSERTLERARNAFILPFLETAARVDWQALLDDQDAGATAGAAGSLEGRDQGASRADGGQHPEDGDRECGRRERQGLGRVQERRPECSSPSRPRGLHRPGPRSPRYPARPPPARRSPGSEAVHSQPVAWASRAARRS